LFLSYLLGVTRIEFIVISLSHPRHRRSCKQQPPRRWSTSFRRLL
jgi:hypothetical protein